MSRPILDSADLTVGQSNMRIRAVGPSTSPEAGSDTNGLIMYLDDEDGRAGIVFGPEEIRVLKRVVSAATYA